MSESIGPNQNVDLEKALHDVHHLHITGEESPETFEAFRKGSLVGPLETHAYDIVGALHDPDSWNQLPKRTEQDASHRIVLRYREDPIATISFNIRHYAEWRGQYHLVNDWFSPKGNDITEFPINMQIQGGGGLQGELCNAFRWEKLLLQVYEDWAKRSGFEACLTRQLKKTDLDPIPFCTQYHIRYNKTPERMGYKLWEGVWRKNLKV